MLKRLQNAICAAFIAVAFTCTSHAIGPRFAFPSGTDGEVQFEQNGLFAGDPDFTYSTTTNHLAVSSITASRVNSSTLSAVERIEFTDGTVFTNASADITAVTVTAPLTGGGSSGAVSIGVDGSSVTLQGNTLGGDISGTLSNVAVTNDSHAHTGTTLSGIDVSDDTNLAVTSPVILTGDTLSLGTIPTDLLPAGTSIYIQNSSSLQSGAVFHISSGTVTGNLSINTAATLAAHAVRFSQLKMIQSTVAYSAVQEDTTSSSFQNTSLDATITPTSASNRILILAACPRLTGGISGTNSQYLTIKRDSTNIGSSSGLSQTSHAAGHSSNVFLIQVDSPATTSAVTYTVAQASSNGSTTVTFGGSAHLGVIYLAEIVYP